ncbi:hypothetical protein EVG22_24480 [Bacillus thuringiensis serovar andalousiensis]|uniref:Uncharacterized protein n=1 Tax=Bacillus thuringiensis serovar andalousiensis TaxID=257985 RepID=A0A6H0TTK2_BACTU|nr:hypothetical protein EVG22_24480 [Bacillus thuringiensis serovar andalousiensis]
MDKFQQTLNQGAILINQKDRNGVELRQFDEVYYKEATYIIIWHPIEETFVGSPVTGRYVPFSELVNVKYLKNLKKEKKTEHQCTQVI